ncbi:protein involved in gliding motility GldI [Sinomicrobium oceani]|uniref:Peptidyl-prolyl cis-trans isomerase n=1 Tax=Sinomicrobium oceani TaxID=1150368 RepID=A0A1K1MRR1_9FLAO|nr:gliding motility-associated peptidyl-prolyl isomerase GldI [Sinomicrobium oceani]SFW25799.1 protein involved in gliding motility GldI [Sinomicrobium oceani]
MKYGDKNSIISLIRRQTSPICPVLLFLFLFCACNEPQARRPVTVKTGEFFKKSVERNRELLEKEQKFIEELIKKDSIHTYIASPNGYWYHYIKKNTETSYRPKADDLILINYDIRYLNDSIIYSSEEIGNIRYKVDKEDLFPGLRTAVKLLKKGETATFMFPSSLAFGYHGDENRIGVNIPVKSTISLIDILETAPGHIGNEEAGAETNDSDP